MVERRLGIQDNIEYQIEEVKEIEKDLKSIKVTNFYEAYDTFKKALPHMVNETDFYDFHKIFRVANLPCECEAYIIKKMRCKGLKGNDHFRVVFRKYNTTIQIIEVYYKSQKNIEDKNRICKYCR